MAHRAREVRASARGLPDPDGDRAHLLTEDERAVVVHVRGQHRLHHALIHVGRWAVVSRAAKRRVVVGHALLGTEAAPRARQARLHRRQARHIVVRPPRARDRRYAAGWAVVAPRAHTGPRLWRPDARRGRNGRPRRAHEARRAGARRPRQALGPAVAPGRAHAAPIHRRQPRPRPQSAHGARQRGRGRPRGAIEPLWARCDHASRAVGGVEPRGHGEARERAEGVLVRPGLALHGVAGPLRAVGSCGALELAGLG
mmetsp:Transcript_4723/g.14420  ORF Transcript_4723/g.14420 Transcript_4723/m.14420 type:complete len:256 (-) Transcript_4723:2265-3032(-)